MCRLNIYDQKYKINFPLTKIYKKSSIYIINRIRKVVPREASTVGLTLKAETIAYNKIKTKAMCPFINYFLNEVLVSAHPSATLQDNMIKTI